MTTPHHHQQLPPPLPQLPPIPTLYDETHQKIHYLRPHILDNLHSHHQLTSGFQGHLSPEHYDPEVTDGSFTISLGSGDGNFISKAFLKGIPRARRPRIFRLLAEGEGEGRMDVEVGSAHDRGTHRRTMERFVAVGRVLLPVIFRDTSEAGGKFRIKLWLYVVEGLPVPVFLASAWWIPAIGPRSRFYIFDFDFDHGRELRVKGLPMGTFTSFGKLESLEELMEREDDSEETPDLLDMTTPPPPEAENENESENEIGNDNIENEVESENVVENVRSRTPPCFSPCFSPISAIDEEDLRVELGDMENYQQWDPPVQDLPPSRSPRTGDTVGNPFAEDPFEY
ncbi:MAG: hypothetical protein MMC33_001231 [Icmadophila ericetorum]|nr:hypothetical protein [Icmadophila ericetorum]